MARRRLSPRLHPQTHTSEDGAGMARRRRCSPRLRPQIHVSDEGAGMTCRRCPRLHPQIHKTEDVAGITCRRSPRLHSQTPTIEDGARMACRGSRRHHRRITRRRRPRPRRGTSLQDNEDMLWEILLRLPPQPSSLPRASAVCKRWRGIVTDPRFLRRFRAHHRKPPLLGVFESFDEIMLSWRRPMSNRHFRSFNSSFNRMTEFRSILEPPDEIPLQGIETSFHSGTELFGCRHGRALLMDSAQEKMWVCDPITGEQHRVYTPPDLRYLYLNVAVLCAATEQGHVHGSCHSCPFKVVVMSPCGEGDQPVACVYSSDTGVWGNIITTMAQCGLGDANPGILVGNALYWSSESVSTGASPLNLKLTDDIIEFDLDRQSLALIKGPPDLNGSLVHQIIKTKDGALGLVVFSQGRLKMWEREVNPHGAATWFLQKTVELHTILGLPTQIERSVAILGYDEDNGVIFLYVAATIYMVKLMSMESTELSESSCAYRCYPFTSFCAPGEGMADAFR